MALHTDIPSINDVQHLAAHRDPASVSIYIPTSAISFDNHSSRIEFKNAVSEATRQLAEAGTEAEAIHAVEEFAQGLTSDGPFWKYLSNSLAVFLTPERMQTYRLPNKLTKSLEVSDRFFLKPLLRAVTFPHTAFVLALAQNRVRLVEVTRDSPAAEVTLENFPANIDEAVPAIEEGRENSSRLMAHQGGKVRLEQYCRTVDRALRPLLTGTDTPLILAAADPLASIYRSVSSLPHLATQVLQGNPEAHSNADLADQARTILDDKYRADIESVQELITETSPRDRVATDLQQVARAATFGAVDTLLVDIDAHDPGHLDEETGHITFGSGDAVDYGIGDEIARRSLSTGARVIAVRTDDIPGDSPVAALLRYPI